MRQGQQNRRGRGRPNNNHGHGGNHGNNNNRKNQNPLSRSYESNGPDVKIRGNPAHNAEKYMTLARDAQSAGDSVQAEAYYQHAEHYNRIIMEFRETQQRPGGESQGMNRPRGQSEGGEGGPEEFAEHEGDFAGEPLEASGQPIRGQEPQPGIFDPAGPPRFPERQARDDRGFRDDRGNRDDRGYRDDRQPRRNEGHRGQRDRYSGGPSRGYNQDRPERRDRYQQDRNGQDRHLADRGPQDRPAYERERQVADPASMEPAEAAPVAVVDADMVAAPEARETPAPSPRRRGGAADRFAGEPQDAPDFLRRPVRRPRREATAENGEDAADKPDKST